MHSPNNNAGNNPEPSSPAPYIGPFRFKSSADETRTRSSGSWRTRSRRRRRRSHSRSPSLYDHHDGLDHRHRRRYHRSSRDRSRSPRRPASPSSKPRSPGPAPRGLSPDTAFRESLFDAMADDEGAAYWEGVYGQPIHDFGPLPRADGESYEGTDYNDPTVLDADAYAAFVRRKMWERSHQHIIEERKRREEQAKRRREEVEREKERARKYDEEERGRRYGKGWEDDYGWKKGSRGNRNDEQFDSKVEESLRRGERRREAKRWREAWERYSEQWMALAPGSDSARKEGAEGSGSADRMVTNGDVQLPWPVRSGKRADVSSSAVEEFFQKALAAAAEKEGMAPSVTLKGQLKMERVRWHPDKVMQRFNTTVDKDTMKTVTAVWQIVDQMWVEVKDEK